MARRIWLVVLVALVAATAIGVSIGQDSNTSTEVRINARQLEDGRVEFGLQQRGGGSWGERILPRVRKLPANAPVGQWLSSSPVLLTTQASVITSSGNLLADQYNIPLLRDTGRDWIYDDDETTRYGVSVRIDDDDGSQSLSTDIGAWIGGSVWLTIACDAGERSIRLDSVPIAPAGAGGAWSNRYFNVQYWVYTDSLESPSISEYGLQWDTWTYAGSDGTRGVWVNHDAKLFLQLRNAQAIVIELVGNGTRQRYSTRLGALFGTPAQPNIDHCGDYAWDESWAYTGNGH